MAPGKDSTPHNYRHHNLGSKAMGKEGKHYRHNYDSKKEDGGNQMI